MTLSEIQPHLALKFNCRSARVGRVRDNWVIALGYRDNRRIGEAVFDWAYDALGRDTVVCAESTEL